MNKITQNLKRKKLYTKRQRSILSRISKKKFNKNKLVVKAKLLIRSLLIQNKTLHMQT